MTSMSAGSRMRKLGEENWQVFTQWGTGVSFLYTVDCVRLFFLALRAPSTPAP
ncbi:hypothetical protein DPMN_157987 [Dreissena polymorpha]|uniref:Uncharacterized protein n=1 Tax=Dreissena polymorpha TaxID=45954 RepID=A0A9D4EH26_DREPO|nr:hypothetical protein DPMN_157987 [Dreissena polymorpha]